MRSFTPVIDDTPLSSSSLFGRGLSSCYPATSWDNVLSYSGCLPQSRLRMCPGATLLARVLDACLVPSAVLATRDVPSLGDVLPRGRAPRRREGVDSPTLGEFCSHRRYRPRRRPCLTHFAPSSVILVVPDGIDSLRNDQTRPPLIRCIRFHRFRRGGGGGKDGGGSTGVLLSTYEFVSVHFRSI